MVDNWFALYIRGYISKIYLHISFREQYVCCSGTTWSESAFVLRLFTAVSVHAFVFPLACSKNRIVFSTCLRGPISENIIELNLRRSQQSNNSTFDHEEKKKTENKGFRTRSERTSGSSRDRSRTIESLSFCFFEKFCVLIQVLWNALLLKATSICCNVCNSNYVLR